jgi:hypothetical protein
MDGLQHWQTISGNVALASVMMAELHALFAMIE